MTFIVNSRYNHRLVTIFTSNYEDTPDIDGSIPSVSGSGRGCIHACTRCATSSSIGGADYRLLPPNPEVDDLIALWKVAGEQKSKLPSRTKGQVRAQIKPPDRGLGWTGGKAGNRE